MNTNKGIVATYTDRYGQTRKIHDTRHGLTVKREISTVALTLNRPIAAWVGNRIREERLKAGLTLEELCLRAGLVSATPKSRMWEIENQVRKEGLRFGTLYAIAAALGLEASALMPTVQQALDSADLHFEPRESLALQS